MPAVKEHEIKGAIQCGFCSGRDHDLCPGAIRWATKARKDSLWLCPCPCNDAKDARCLECKRRHSDPEEINPVTWSCIDQTACKARVNKRLDGNPLLQQIRTIERKHEMAKAEQKKERVPAEPKVGTCLVTGKATKGGKFLPGMDAKFVSIRVNAVMDKSETEAQARKQFKDNDLSEALLAKFEKSLGLARDRAVKEAEAAKEKAAAKKEKAKASA